MMKLRIDAELHVSSEIILELNWSQDAHHDLLYLQMTLSISLILISPPSLQLSWCRRLCCRRINISLFWSWEIVPTAQGRTLEVLITCRRTGHHNQRLLNNTSSNCSQYSPKERALHLMINVDHAGWCRWRLGAVGGSWNTRPAF